MLTNQTTDGVKSETPDAIVTSRPKPSRGDLKALGGWVDGVGLLAWYCRIVICVPPAAYQGRAAADHAEGKVVTPDTLARIAALFRHAISGFARSGWPADVALLSEAELEAFPLQEFAQRNRAVATATSAARLATLLAIESEAATLVTEQQRWSCFNFI